MPHRPFMPKRKKTSNKQVSRARSGTSVQSALPLSVLAGVVLIVVAVMLAYSPAINGGFIVDDILLLTKSELIKAADGLYRFWCSTKAPDYWPVTNSSLWIEWRLWEMNPTGYHLTNLILHIVEALLIWIILRKLSIPGAFLAAMIFAVHPVNVESVAWISQRKNVLAMLFFLLSILCYLKMEIQSSSSQNGIDRIASPLAPFPSPLATRHSPLWYWLSLVAFLLAMLSKGSVAMLPVLLLGIIWWLRPLTRWDLVRTAPFFVVAVVLTVVNMRFQRHGADEVVRNVDFAQRLLGAGGVVWFYLYKALLPLNLAFVYPQWQIEAGNLLWWLPLLAAVAVTGVLWCYRESWSRPLLFAWGFFCVALLPVMGFTDVGFMKYSLVADHYQHIAIIGLISLAAALWGIWYQRTREIARWPATAVAIVAVAALTFLTWQQCGIYRDAMTLYQDTLEKNPECWMAHYSLGVTLGMKGQTQKAIEHYKQALWFKPDYVEAHNNLGLELAQTGRPQEAIEHYQQALGHKPDFYEAYNNLGNALVQVGRTQEAIEHYLQALQLKPDNPDAH
ncbi:MAG TPA: tetratricopeptide repeat protein, partial [Thermoguttaceae bacterium]